MASRLMSAVAQRERQATPKVLSGQILLESNDTIARSESVVDIQEKIDLLAARLDDFSQRLLVVQRTLQSLPDLLER